MTGSIRHRAALAGLAGAQAYPSRPVTLVVGFGAGAGVLRA